MSVLGDRPWFGFWPDGVPYHIEYPEVPLFELLSSSATRYPDSIAFNYLGHSYTYRELDILTNKLAYGLNQLGINKGDRIVLLLPNCPEFIIGYYGILKAGGSVVPVNPLYKARELKHHLNDSGAAGILANTNSCALIGEIKAETRLKTVILADTEGDANTISLQQILTQYPPAPLGITFKPKEDIAAIEYTGGTTGLPKGVMLTHYNLVANAIQNAAWFSWSKEEVVIGILPFYHSWGACTCVNSPMYCGARVIILPHFDFHELLGVIEKERATIMYGATSMFTMLASNPQIAEYDLSSLKYVKAGAMPIPPEIKKRWEKTTGVKMMLGYGLSEASPETHNCSPHGMKVGSIGIPIIDTDARVVDMETGDTELPAGEVGELVIKGPQVMKGYLNQSEDTQYVIRKGWLYTGDLAKMDETGHFYIVDRKKETIKYKGYTIAPAEVEAILYEHPAVKECAVVGKPDALAGEIPKAYVVLRDGYSLCAEELIDYCGQMISGYKKIREVEFVTEIPKTPVGKVLRMVLKDRN